jgi:hypothetical protein
MIVHLYKEQLAATCWLCEDETGKVSAAGSLDEVRCGWGTTLHYGVHPDPARRGPAVQDIVVRYGAAYRARYSVRWCQREGS